MHFLLFCFLSLNKCIFQARKKAFYFASKVFLILEIFKFLKIENLEIKDMVSRKTLAINKKYIFLKNVEGNGTLSKSSTKNMWPGNHFQGLLCLYIIKPNLYCKMKCLKQDQHIRYVTVKLLNNVKITMQIFSDSFLQRILQNKKRPGTSFEVTFFVQCFNIFWTLRYFLKKSE